MIELLLTQVQYLMELQYKHLYIKGDNYSWISYHRQNIALNLKDEITIRRLAQKLTPDQCFGVVKRLNKWYKQNNNADYLIIPQICIDMLNKEYSLNMLQNIPNRRSNMLDTVKYFVPNFIWGFIEQLSHNNKLN